MTNTPDTFIGQITHLGLSENGPAQRNGHNTIGFHVVINTNCDKDVLDNSYTPWYVKGVREPFEVEVDDNCKAIRLPEVLEIFGQEGEFRMGPESRLKLAGSLTICAGCTLTGCPIHPDNLID